VTQQKKPTPATPSLTHARMSPRWELAEALLGGTETMRAAGETYLPQHEQETNKNYANRLNRATLLNLTELTLEALVGRPFSKPVVLDKDVPTTIKEYAEDLDLQGNNLQSFSRAFFREGWGKGLSHVLVDFPTPAPKTDEAGNAVARTLEDDRKEGLRPFAVRIRPENLIAAYSEVTNGEERLTHIRILEVAIVRNEWEEVLEPRIRVLEPGKWAVYKPADKDEWALEDEGETPLDFIPLVTFYAGKREGLHECKPPLTDLMHLNIAHWQSSSDQRNVLTVARFPILAGSGVSSTDNVSIGPNNFLATEAPEGKWYYVEHTGAAITAGRDDLKDLEEQMAGYGAEFLKKKVGGETATARALDSAEGMSYLQATALDFQDSLELILHYFARWMRLESGGSVQVYTNFASGEAAATDLEALLKLRVTKDISRTAVLDEFQRRGVLADDFDPIADKKLLDDEAEDQPEGLGDMFGGGAGTAAPGKVLPKPGEEDDVELEA
jgi:hypothetical protein